MINTNLLILVAPHLTQSKAFHDFSERLHYFGIVSAIFLHLFQCYSVRKSKNIVARKLELNIRKLSVELFVRYFVFAVHRNSTNFIKNVKCCLKYEQFSDFKLILK